MTSLIHVKWLKEINGSCLKDVNVYVHILLLDAPNCNKDGNITCIFVFHSKKDQKELAELYNEMLQKRRISTKSEITKFPLYSAMTLHKILLYLGFYCT